MCTSKKLPSRESRVDSRWSKVRRNPHRRAAVDLAVEAPEGMRPELAAYRSITSAPEVWIKRRLGDAERVRWSRSGSSPAGVSGLRGRRQVKKCPHRVGLVVEYRYEMPKVL